MDALLGKDFKTAKFKSLVELVSLRIAVWEKQHHLRCMQAQSDVVALLKLGHQESALLLVELVITEQNMLDAYSMIENFCNLLVERVVLIESKRECPDELKEAISSLIFAASKCGEMQDLEKISSMFVKRYGKEFASNAVVLCNNCGVSPKIVLKLSTHRPNTERKLTMLKEIAVANGIDLHHEGDRDQSQTVTQDTNEKQLIPHESANKDGQEHCIDHLSTERKQGEKIHEQVMERWKYKNFKAAAQAAYKLAAHAAVAAKAALELLQPLDGDHDHPRKSNEKKYETQFDDQPSKSGISIQGYGNSERKNDLERGIFYAKVIPSSSPRHEKTETNTGGHLKED
ncbi:uncharacterized protein LOC21392006 [Morus notabilis]|nr:uncharacterized protein LOC21392006 [Morus notabilis]